MQHAVAHQNESGVIGRLAPLMKIESQRIRALDAFEPRRQIRSQNRQRAARAIDVEPEPFATADGGQSVEVVDGPGVDRAGRSHHQERREAGAAIRVDGFLQSVQIASDGVRLTGIRRSASLPMPAMSMAFPMQLCAATEA